MVKQLKRIGGGAHGPMYPEGGSIGVPLEECPIGPCEPCPVPGSTESVPYLVKLCCDIVSTKGLEIVGIYRVPGNNASVTYLTEQINKGVDFFALEDHRWQDVNVVSSLLKSFFRKLPDPLFTADMYSLFIEASKVEQAPRRMDQLRKLIRELPEFHFETLKYVTHHLCQVAAHSSSNKMEVRNLAIVFGPTLVRTSDDNMVSMVTDMSQQCRIIESLLSNWEYFFSEEEVEVKDDGDDSNNPGTSVGNESQLMENLRKLEEAGKIGSPKGQDVSAKDIVSSIISAANRKMLKASSGKGKKESSVESERGSSVTRMEEGVRRESEAVIHGALQIAGAVPGLVSPVSDDRELSSSDGERPASRGPAPYSRQNSRGSISVPGGAGGRRGSGAQAAVHGPSYSKRGSISEGAGGEVVIRQTHTNGHGGSEQVSHTGHNLPLSNAASSQVVTGKLSLVNVPGYPRVSPDISVSSVSVVSNTLSVAGAVLRPDSAPPPPTSDFRFPIESYAGLQAANAERVAKFEAETKAMLTQRSGLAKSSQDISEGEGLSMSSHHRHGELIREQSHNC